ncbi:C-C chemokine receptor type 6 [Scleropages formosus]|uniref:C-C motif chemokine receptor 6 n=1 Tax=Scleropages formosus TaxID=113540 RepID=A0A8C9RAJ0_SCLFO|nr:C-C chemokine receptor type 6-like [Scleropages formosus]
MDYENFSSGDYELPCEMNDTRQMELGIQVYVHSFICLFGLLGNLLVIITYAFYKKAKTMTDMYLLNMAIADVLFVLSLPLMIYNERHNWSMGTWACKIFRGMYNINLYSSMLLLACISTDRYIAIVQARRSFRMRYRTLIYSQIICSAVWLFSLALSVPSMVYNERYEDTHLGVKSEAVCYFRFDDNRMAQLVKILVPTTQITIGFFLPLLVMCFCYTCIIITLLRAKNFQKHKAVRVVLAVVVVFIACQMPYNITLLYHTVELFQTRECSSEKDVLKVLMITESLAYLHCCLNPVLYAFIGVKFRNHFCKILEDLWCLGKRYIYRRSSRVTSEVYISTRRSTEGSNNENGSSFTM